MDLAYLLRRERIERSNARAAPAPAGRLIHDRLADLFGDRIDALRRATVRG